MDISTQQNINIEKNIAQKDLQPDMAQSGMNAQNQPSEELSAEQIAKNVEIDMKKVNFKDELEVFLKQKQDETGLFSFDFAQTFKFDTISISKEDADFFLDLIEYNKEKKVENNQQNMNVLMPILQNNNVEAPKEVVASSKIINMLETCVNTKKPVRIDFDNNITLVLRVDTEGKVMAHFYPNDKAAEEYLRNNIGSLKQKFDDENILYSYLGYNGQKRDNQKERQEK